MRRPDPEQMPRIKGAFSDAIGSWITTTHEAGRISKEHMDTVRSEIIRLRSTLRRGFGRSMKAPKISPTQSL